MSMRTTTGRPPPAGLRMTRCSTTFGLDGSTPWWCGIWIACIMGAVARTEVERKSVRQKRAARQRAEAGMWWGPRPFGYTDAGALLEREAAAVREAYSAILANASLYSVARRWNADGLRTTHNNTWSGRSVKQPLLRPRYAGYRFYGEEILGKSDWPATVSEEVWHAVHDILTNPNRPVSFMGRKHLLSGIARCGKCGAAIGVSAKAGRPVYVCKRCFGVSRVQAAVDNWALWRVANALTQPDAWRALMTSDSDDAARLRDQETVLRSRLGQLATQFADGVLTPSQIRTATERVRGRSADVQSQLYGPNRPLLRRGVGRR
jgi:site-specific DNA recombinase